MMAEEQSHSDEVGLFDQTYIHLGIGISLDQMFEYVVPILIFDVQKIGKNSHLLWRFYRI